MKINIDINVNETVNHIKGEPEAPNRDKTPEQSPQEGGDEGMEHEVNIVTPISIAEDSKLTTKDAYHSYWHCRDFELTHLWQRSIFLATFLLFFCSAYGALFAKMLDNLLCTASDKWCSVFWLFSHGAAILLSIIILVLACLWIMTAKASKLWYEIYENAIKAYTEDNDHINVNDVDANKILGFRYENLKNYEYPSGTDKLSASDGGSYSVSRINWAIGYMFLWIGRVLSMLHCICFFGTLGGFVAKMIDENSEVLGVGVGIFVGIVVGGIGVRWIPRKIANCEKLKSLFLVEFMRHAAEKKK